MVDKIDIHTLNLDELNGVVNIYPWFSGARLELFSRMQKLGAVDDSMVSQTALYLGSRRTMSNLIRSVKKTDYSDKQVGELLRSYIKGTDSGEEKKDNVEETPERRIFVVGGDYFSQDQYNDVRKKEDNIFSSFATIARAEGYREQESEYDPDDFCTEALAEIYLEQGYLTEAKNIYSKLSLRYPEKSVYFAALIEKINKNN